MQLEYVLSEVKDYVESNKGFFVTTGMLIGGQILDALINHYGFQKGFFNQEHNLFIKNVVETYGISAMYLTKLGVTLVCTLVALRNNSMRYLNAFQGIVYTAAAVANTLEVLLN